MPLDAAIEAFRMIEPPSWKMGSAFCTVNSLSRWRQILPNGANSPMPAFAKRISIRPLFLLTVAYNRSRSARFETSPWTPVTFLPIRSTATSSSRYRRPVMKTWAPSVTNRCAVANPMPLFPPVLWSSQFPLVVLLLADPYLHHNQARLILFHLHRYYYKITAMWKVKFSTEVRCFGNSASQHHDNYIFLFLSSLFSMSGNYATLVVSSFPFNS